MIRFILWFALVSPWAIAIGAVLAIWAKPRQLVCYECEGSGIVALPTGLAFGDQQCPLCHGYGRLYKQ